MHRYSRNPRYHRTIVLIGTLMMLPATGAAQSTPTLPAIPFNYSAVPLPDHYLANGFPDPRLVQTAAVDNDNTPSGNPITDEGATLGRVLFYDKKLSANGTISCASCHLQRNGFSDPARLSLGFDGGTTRRHSMGLSNARFNEAGKFFWDERADTLEDQVLMPFQDEVEMGLTLEQLVGIVQDQPYYAAMFGAAFGEEGVDSDRIARALAQFVRSIVSIDSKYDQARVQAPDPLVDFPSFSAEENRGKRIFMSTGNAGAQTPCIGCHQSEAFVSPVAGPGPGPGSGRATTTATNNGLDAFSTTDLGVAESTGNPADAGKFKVPSLRDIGVRAPYMHDGRFATLEEVIDHYSDNIQNHPNLQPALRRPDGTPANYNFNSAEKTAIVAFLQTLTDENLLADEKLSDPFLDPNVPAVTAVVNAASFAGVVASHTWVSVFGHNLAESSRGWTAADFVGGALPINLDDVSVTFNGKPAYVAFVSPTQLNVLVPAGLDADRADVQVTNSLGTSNTAATSQQSVAPALFTFGTGVQYAAAVHADGAYVAKEGLLPGSSARPARAGDPVMLFGTGFGDTSPLVADGTILVTPLQLSTSVTVLIGGVSSAVAYAGMVGAGLCQFNVTIPGGIEGDVALAVVIDGVTSQADVMITIAP